MSVFNPLTSDYSSQMFSEIGKKLYLNSESADVHFVFESNEERELVPAHKAHLMAGSDVFATMFNGSWKESKEVKIVDASAAAFKEFLQFFYCGQVKLTMENVAAVMNLGEMYNVAECLAVCSKFVKNNLNIDNVYRNHELAVLLNQEKLKKTCEIFIGINIKTVFKSKDFMSCDRKILAQILKLDWLSCTEVELFEACMSWVKSASKQDNLTKEVVEAHLDDLFHKFRFGSMTFHEFASLVPTYGNTFSFDEHKDVIQMIADPKFHSTIFDGNRVARCDFREPWHESDGITCVRRLSYFRSYVSYQIKNVETTVFSTNETLLLRGFHFAKIVKHLNHKYVVQGDVPTNVTIVEVDDLNSNVILHNGNYVLKSANSVSIFIDRPILVRPGFTYEIRCEQTAPENCCTSVLMKSRVKLESGQIIQFHRDPVLEKDPTIARGLISKLFLKSA